MEINKNLEDSTEKINAYYTENNNQSNVIERGDGVEDSSKI